MQAPSITVSTTDTSPIITTATSTSTTTTSIRSTTIKTSNTKTSTVENVSNEKKNETVELPRMVVPALKLSSSSAPQDQQVSSPKSKKEQAIPKSPRLLKQKPSQINLQVESNEMGKKYDSDENSKILAAKSEPADMPSVESPAVSEPVFMIRKISLSIAKNPRKQNTVSSPRAQISPTVSHQQFFSDKFTDVSKQTDISVSNSSQTRLQISNFGAEAKGLAVTLCSEFYNNTENKCIKSGNKLQDYFFSIIKNTDAWKKILNARNLAFKNNIQDQLINSYSDDSKKMLQEIIKDFAEDTVNSIIGLELKSSALPQDLITFLLHADHLLLEAYLDSSKLPVKDINTARIGFLKDLLLKNILLPLLIQRGSATKMNIVEMWFMTNQFNKLTELFKNLSKDFLAESYEAMLPPLKSKLNNLIQRELNKEEDEKNSFKKSRISAFKSKKSSRSLTQDNEKKPNPIEEKARLKIILKNNKGLIQYQLKNYGFENLDDKFKNFIILEMQELAKKSDSLHEIEIVKKISELTKMHLYIEEFSNNEIEGSIRKFDRRIDLALEKIMAIQTKQRATMLVENIDFDALFDNLNTEQELTTQNVTESADSGEQSATQSNPESGDDLFLKKNSNN